MIPAFLKKFEAELEKYKRECIRIKAIPLEEDPLQDPLDKMTSKILGIPFYPISKSYPKDKEGRSMVLFAQINFAELPPLKPFPEDGILQLFLSPDDWFGDDVAIVYHSALELKSAPMEDFSFLTTEDYEEMPAYKLHRLSFELQVDHGGSEDVQFDFQFGEKDYWDFTENLSEEEENCFNEYFDASGHKIGGYAEFTQADPRNYEPKKRADIQVLQIDTDEEIMFGDSGIGHIFINQEALLKKDFSQAYFYWDCC